MAGGGELLQLRKRALEVVPPFRGMDHRQLAILQDGSDIPAPPRHLRQRGIPRAEALERVEPAQRGAERLHRQHRRRVHAVGEQAQPALPRARQIDLLPQRIPAPRPAMLAAEIAAQVIRVQGRVRVQVGHRRGEVQRPGIHQCCVTRTVVFICLPVSRSRADMVRMPSMFTSKVISRRAFPATPDFSPGKRKSPSSSLCATCGASPWKMRIATSVWPSYEMVASVAFAVAMGALRGKSWWNSPPAFSSPMAIVVTSSIGSRTFES